MPMRRERHGRRGGAATGRAALGALLLLAGAAQASELSHGLRPERGRPAPEAPLAVASPDGSGLPAGEGTVARGRDVYAAQCAACHGSDGRQAGNALVGGRGTLATPSPQKTVESYWPYATTLFDYVAVAMPYGDAGSLPPDDVYAVTAYVLHLGGVLPADAVLDRESLIAVEMPNRDGFDERTR
jgi:mono/diheme cytochrome c family protein